MFNPFAWLAKLPSNEPVLVSQAVSAGLTLAVSFGWHLSAEQIAEAASVSAVITGFVIRPHVTPNAKTVIAAVEAAAVAAAPASGLTPAERIAAGA